MSAILLIDDDKDFSGLAAAHFSKQGHAVTLAEGGREGLDKASASRPDIVLLDIMMPDMNGIEVLRELSSDPDTSDIPVIILTGKYIDPGMGDMFGQERNFRGVVAKPVDLGMLQRKIEELLAK
ncbi:MAG: twitching motility protein PilH [Elusimicrobia bacterium]|nr:MAG: twitching motility protein PilH [Elusimicrobiota bacterium]KAF0154612.1 MAG: twitching motility protein PilH [Elusimicrobiota bacterium]